LGIVLQHEPVRLISRRVLNRVLASKEKVRYRKIMYAFSGFGQINLAQPELNNLPNPRNFGENSSLALEILLSYTNVVFNGMLVFSVLFFVISILMGFYVIVVDLTYNKVVPGWSTTMLFLSFGFSGLFLMSGVLIKYLDMILNETKQRPPYNIESVKIGGNKVKSKSL
jgi:dolichol-phosphate mannosyltransferase